MTKKQQALIGAFVSVIAASFSAIFIRIAINYDVNPVILAFWRLFLTCIILLPYTLSKLHYRKEIRNFSKSQFIIMIISGVLLSIHFSSWFMSLQYTSTVSSTLLVCTEPIFVIIGSFILFREKPCGKAMIGLFIAAIGVMLVAMPSTSAVVDLNNNTTLLGNLLALLGAISVSGYVLSGRAIMHITSTLLYSTLVYTVCCIAIFLLTLLLGLSVLDINSIGLIMAAGLALVCQLIGHTICNWALKYTKAANVSSIYLLEPVGTALWVFLIWQEIPTKAVLTGGLILLLGIFYFIRCESQSSSIE